VSLKSAGVHEYDPLSSDEEKNQALADNFNAIRRAFGLTGVKPLVSTALTSATAVTSATYKVFAGLTSAFNSSGGFLDLDFRTVIDFAGGNGSVGLFLDGEQVDFANFGTYRGHVALGWKGFRPRGSHTVEVRAYASGPSAVTVAYANSNARLSVVETLI
jgi:hypothetical protein